MSFISRFVKRKLKKIERKVSYGSDNKDKKFYVIGVYYRTAGLFAIFKSILGHIGYAIDKNYIPVVDMFNFENQFLNIENGNIKNPWEFFFKQPCNYSLNDIKHSKNIILSKQVSRPNKKYRTKLNLLDKDQSAKLMYFRGVYNKYIEFSPDIKSKMERDYKNIIGPNKKVLGVLCRGTDYILKKPSGHPIQPEPTVVLKKAKEVFKSRDLKHVFLATEDKLILDLFLNEFGEKLLYINQKRFDSEELNDVQYICKVKNNTISDRYSMAVEYLSAINILSKCNCFIGGRTAGTFGVYIFTKGFDYDYTWDLGYYQ